MDYSIQTQSSIYQYAQNNDCTLTEAAIRLNSRMISHKEIWQDPVVDEGDDSRVDINLFIDGHESLITFFANEISKRIQFPRSTILLHSLGVIASAMCKSFKVNYDGDEYPVTLYCVTAQPPSTGKSGVNKYLTTPISTAYTELNKENKKKRFIIEKEIKELQREIEKDSFTDVVMLAKLTALDEAETKLSKYPIWRPFFTQATIEAIDETASQQDGMFNICSAEAESMTVVLGNVYGDDKSAKNYGLILSAWDGEEVSGGRVSRESACGSVRGCIAVIAQDESIRAVLKAANDRGVSERFLLLAEKDLLGTRDHSKRYHINQGTINSYNQLIHNIIMEDDVVLHLGKKSLQLLQDTKQAIEPELGDGGKYSTNLLRGVLGKADKQIIKIASVLHTIDHWQEGGAKSKEIEHNYVEWALGLYDLLSKTYIETADSVSHSGKKTESQKVIDVLTRFAEKGKTEVPVRAIYDAVKNLACFSGRKKLMTHIRDHLLIEVEQRNYCVVSGNTIYINPRLK